MLELIVAMDENNVIGDGKQMPWYLPDDLRRLRLLTTGNTIIMGRRTYESIGHALPNRRNIVLTRQTDWDVPDADVYHSVEDVLDNICTDCRVFVFGGAEIYNQFMPLVSVMHVTRVHYTFDGDVIFPQWQNKQWQLVEQISCLKDYSHAYNYTFQQFRRRLPHRF